MYVTQSNACTAPNSLQPPSKAAIRRGIRMLGSMESKVRAARQAYNCLFYRNDLNTNGWPLATNGGIPSSTVTGCPAPQDSGQPNAAGTGSTPGQGLNLTGLQYWPSLLVTLPDPTGLAPNSPDAYPQPPAPVTPPLTTEAHNILAKALVKTATGATTSPPTSPPTFPTTGNICLDLLLNYVDPSQVTSQQLLDCATSQVVGTCQRVGNGPLLTTAMIAWRNSNYNALPKIPYQKPQPLTAAQQSACGSGMGDWDGGSFLQGLISAVGVAAAGVYLYNFARKKGYV
jgi:hypothetical protein